MITEILNKVRQTAKDPFQGAKCAALIATYASRWMEGFKGWTLQNIEKELYANVVNLDTGRRSRKYLLHAYVDKVLLDPLGKVVFFDHKTSSEDIHDPAGTYWSRMSIDPQSTIYLLALMANGIEVSRIVWDVVKKPTIRPKASETPDEYFQRCVDWAVDNNAFVRQDIQRSDRDVYELNQNIWQLANELQWRSRSSCYPMACGSCFTYGRLCEYSPVCHFGAEIAGSQFVDSGRVQDPARLETVSHSSLSALQQCPRKYLFRHVLRRVPAKLEGDENLAFGSAYHAGLDSLYSLYFGGKDGLYDGGHSAGNFVGDGLDNGGGSRSTDTNHAGAESPAEQIQG